MIRDVWHQTLDVRHQTSYMRRWQQTLDIRHQKSSIWPLMSDVWCLITDVWCDKCMIFDTRSQISDFRHLMSEVKCLMSDISHQTSDIRHQAYIRLLTSASKIRHHTWGPPPQCKQALTDLKYSKVIIKKISPTTILPYHIFSCIFHSAA